MDFEFTPEEKAYQQELCEFLDREVNEGVIAETESMQGPGPYSKELVRKLGAMRLLTPAWPQEYGGRGLSYVAATIFMDELTYHRGPFPLDGIDIGDTLLHFGSDSQKQRFLPKIASGEIDFALGFTEPDAGSDLASLQLHAVQNGDQYILNGQKIYNTEAHHADYHWLLARTDPDVPSHKGLSLFMVDLKSSGITIRPLTTMAGLRTNEVFYEDVRVPAENIVGGVNQGWVVAQNALRGGGPGFTAGSVRQRFVVLVKYLLEERRDIWSGNPWIPDELAKYHIMTHICDLLAYKVACISDQRLPLSYEMPLHGLFGDETRKAFFKTVMRILGPYGQLTEGSKWVPLEGAMVREYLDGPRWTIVHGTSEIQRLLIARGLGLPRK